MAHMSRVPICSSQTNDGLTEDEEQRVLSKQRENPSRELENRSLMWMETCNRQCDFSCTL